MTDQSINQAALDRFTSAHAGVGVTMAVLNLPWWAALGTTIGWELAENFLKDRKPHLFPYSSHDSADNSVADAAAVIAGFVTARHLMKRGLTAAGKAALSATVGSTAGCMAGSASVGLLGKWRYGEQEDASRGESPVVSWGRGGYMLGGAIGGALGAAAQVSPRYQEAAALGGAVGGAAFGPMGAALGAYIAVGVEEERPS